MFGADVFVKCQKKKPTILIITSPIKHDISFQNIILKIYFSQSLPFPTSHPHHSHLFKPEFGKPKDISCHWLFLNLKLNCSLGL